MRGDAAVDVLPVRVAQAGTCCRNLVIEPVGSAVSPDGTATAPTLLSGDEQSCILAEGWVEVAAGEGYRSCEDAEVQVVVNILILSIILAIEVAVYIIVPFRLLAGEHWGSEYDVSGKTLKFIGQNVTVHKSGETSPVAGSYYSFIGDTKSVGIEDIYCLNLDGNKFDLDNSSAPFRAYFKANTSNCTKIYLSVGNGGGTTSLSEECNATLSKREFATAPVYDLSGRRVGSTLNKGVYIQNGKLFIKE